MATCNNENRKTNCTNGLKPLVRNQYFYGKLLTVRDFQNEQSYHIKKQRLINKHIHGEGVVCGLMVEAVVGDNSKVKIKSGIALDCCGREIIVPEDVTVDIPSIKAKKSNVYWITISYNECGKEQVAAATEANSCSEECCFSRIKEKYKIEILKEDPEICSSVHVDNLCKLWESLDFDKEESELHPHPSDSGSLINTNEMKIAGHEKMQRVAYNTPEEFVKKYQGVCPSSDNENGPLVLAIVSLSSSKEKELEIRRIDNALVTATGFEKKLVHNNPKLFELLKCKEQKKEEFPQIINYTWEHGKEYESKIIQMGNVDQIIAMNKLTLSINEEYTEQPSIDMKNMKIYFYGEGINKTCTVSSYDANTNQIEVNEKIFLLNNQPYVGISESTSIKYKIFKDETESFLKILEDLEITFSHQMDKNTLTTKTMDLLGNLYIVKDFDSHSGIEIDIPKIEIPIIILDNNYTNRINFTIPTETSEFIKNNLDKVKNLFIMLAAKQQLNSFKQIGLSMSVHLKGDFILDKEGIPLDANHLQGKTPTGNGSAGGIFESWFDLIIDIEVIKQAAMLISGYIKMGNGVNLNEVSENVKIMPALHPYILDDMDKNNKISLMNGKYYPLPDPGRTMIVYETKLETSAKRLSESLKERGVSVTLKNAAKFTKTDKDNYEVILIRDKGIASGTSKKFEDTLSKVSWDKSDGDIEIIHKTDAGSSPIFVIGGKNKSSVEKAIDNYVKRYSTPE